MVEGKLRRKGLENLPNKGSHGGTVHREDGLCEKEKTKENKDTKEHPLKQRELGPNSRVMVPQKGRCKARPE